MWKRCETDFDLDKHLISYLNDVPFFAELSRNLRKLPTKEIKTAAISYDPKADEFVLGWNPDFFKSMTNWHVRSVLNHEFYHIVFGHLNARIKTPADLWNVATDLAINSLIVNHSKNTRPKDAAPGEEPLPSCAYIPGRFPTHKDGREYTPEEKKELKLGTLIESFSQQQASEWYFNKLLVAFPDGKCPDVNLLDDHEGWGCDEEQREYVEGRVKSIIERAVRYADSTGSGWGDIPHDVVSAIRRSVSNIVNWRSLLRQFIGAITRGNRSSTIKRINRRYPYIHPGVKRGYVAKLLVAMDQSGSVPQELVELFFAELDSLTKNVEIDVVIFDSAVGAFQTLRKGQRPQHVRTKSGGTSFDCVAEMFDDPKNRGRWDGLVMLTDGGAPKPRGIRKKRAWVLGPGDRLAFDTDELQIFLSKERPMSGAWR